MLSDIIIKSKLLEFEKSSFLIELKRTSKGKKYLQITQTIADGEHSRSSIIKVNPKILNTLLASLLEFNGEVDRAAAIPKDVYGKDLAKLKAVYLKGSTLESLQLQFPQYSVEDMEAMLRADGVAVVNQVYTPPKKRYYRRKR